MMRTAGIIAVAIASAAFGAATTGWAVHTGRGTGLSPAVLSNTGYDGPAAVPLGDLAGGAVPRGPIEMKNPLGSGPGVIAEGKKMFNAMNCSGCHGYTGGGGMGPPLNDGYWRYGGAPAQVYKSIFEGRPQGMPAWGVALPPEEIWQLTAFVESLGGSVKPGQAYDSRLGDDHEGSTSKAGSPILEGQ
ncbi:c-type cytochrome [Qipengyuania sp. YG27]|uniref:C-type cytochrome n=1 Tax=Qipengyuania mesophila TaxID=2867246 RepID=A0ABS7JRY2_9SPHN|nr:c-type cytochrome [Qipengyuania mesophila]MBX7500405.1 c-type cytochrome [Qipengyuania mesophila]